MTIFRCNRCCSEYTDIEDLKRHLRKVHKVTRGYEKAEIDINMDMRE